MRAFWTEEMAGAEIQRQEKHRVCACELCGWHIKGEGEGTRNEGGRQEPGLEGPAFLAKELHFFFKECIFLKSVFCIFLFTGEQFFFFNFKVLFI